MGITDSMKLAAIAVGVLALGLSAQDQIASDSQVVDGRQVMAINTGWEAFSTKLEPKYRNIAYYTISLGVRGDRYVIDYRPTAGDDSEMPVTENAVSGSVHLSVKTLQVLYVQAPKE